MLALEDGRSGISPLTAGTTSSFRKITWRRRKRSTRFKRPTQLTSRYEVGLSCFDFPLDNPELERVLTKDHYNTDPAKYWDKFYAVNRDA